MARKGLGGSPEADIMIRFFDILLALVALALFAPLALLIAILIKIDSSGPVLFRQRRIGKNGVPFVMLKFRKMREGLANHGPAVTSRYDSRLTVVGRWLERTKLDEIPQLVNVLKGEMAIVGPRPEIEKFTRAYPEQWEKVLAVRPGIIGINQVLNRNESEMYPPDCRDREDYYVRRILPAKLDLDIRYIENASFFYNLALLARAIFRTLTGTVTRDSLISTSRSLYLLGAYTAVGALSLLGAYHLGYQGKTLDEADARVFRMSFPILLILYPAVFLSFRVHRRMFGSVTLEDIAAFFRSCVLGSFLLILALLLFNAREFSRLVYFIDFVFRFLGLVSLAYVEHQIAQKHKLLTSRDILEEVVFESLAASILVLFSVAAVAFMLWPPNEALRNLRESLWVIVSLVGAAPLIYLATFQEVPHRFVYFLKVKMKQTAIMLAQGALFLVIVSLLLDVRDYSRTAVFTAIPIVIAALMAFFTFMWWLRWRKMPEIGRERVLLIGLAPDIDLFITSLQRSHVNYALVGIVSDETRDRFYTVSKIEVLGTLNDLDDVLDVYHVDTFVVSPEGLSPDQLTWVEQVAAAREVRLRHFLGADRFMQGGAGADQRLDLRRIMPPSEVDS